MKIIMSQRFSFIFSIVIIIGFISLNISCDRASQEGGAEIEVDLSSYHMVDGYQLEVVAPVNIIFDEQGRIWVVEMVGYMTDFTGSKEDLPNGRISILEDRNGNGV